MYLKRIEINNYRSIQRVEIDFQNGLNILIGKNGAGKSNILGFIDQYLSYPRLTSTILSRNANVDFRFVVAYERNAQQIETTISFKNEKNISNGDVEHFNKIVVSKKVDGDMTIPEKTYRINVENRITIGIRRNRTTIRTKNRAPNDLLKAIDFLRVFQKTYITFELPYDLKWLSSPNNYEIDAEFCPDSEGYFETLGIIQHFEKSIENQFTFGSDSKINEVSLDDIKKVFFNGFENFKATIDLDNCLSKLTPITELRINPNINVYFADHKILVENLLIDFKVNGSWVPWSFLSDGTRRLFYLITECLSRDSGLLLIEEPELGIHPRQLNDLLDFIKGQSVDKQIIVSTHSPMVLDILSPDELNRISIVKSTENGTKVFPLSTEQIDTAKEYIEKVGELSYYWLHSDLENE